MKYPELESAHLEFKRELPKYDQVVKTMIAFCNGHGGKLVIGVEDDGTVVGISESKVNELLESLDQMIYDGTHPPIIPNIYARRLGKYLVLILEVSSGCQKPYYRKSEGLNKGTYIRLGRTTARASEEMIEEFHWQSRGVDYDRRPVYSAQLQDLDEAKLIDFLKVRKNHGTPKITEEVWRSYHLTTYEHTQAFPTTAGLLLFGKKPQLHFSEAMMICTHFTGNSGRDVAGTVDCEGTLFEQYQQAYAFITSRLSKSYSFENSVRKDILEIPPIALREALLNALLHRNYSLKAPTKVAIYDNRIEIFSPGQLPGPIDLTNLRAGITYLRNPAICKVLREAGYVEKLGSGLIAILDSYEKKGLATPQLLEGKNYVKCILPRGKPAPHPKTDEERILDLFRFSEELSLKDIQTQLQLPRTTAARRVSNLIEKSILKRTGKTKSTRYRLVKKAI